MDLEEREFLIEITCIQFFLQLNLLSFTLISDKNHIHNSTKPHWQLGVVVHICNPSTWETEAEGC
jgi:hypothetical protein